MEKIRTIGICCTTAHKEPVKNIIASLAHKAKESGEYRLLVFQCFGDLFYFSSGDFGSRSVFDLFNCDMLDAMIVLTTSIHDREVVKKIASRCFSKGVQVISLAEEIDGAYCCNLGFGEAFSKIVEHVISVHGCRRIKVLAGYPDNDFSLTRVNSCAEVMERHGLKLAENDILYGNFWDEPTYAAMDKFFESGEPLPDAFVCCNDSMAIAVCAKLTERGYKVPDDVIVTGFDGTEIERYHNPRLCTAVCDENRIADAMIKMVDDITSGRSNDPYSVTVSYDPVFSESCGCRRCSGEARNKLLTDYVRSNTEFRVFEEHMDNMENDIATDPSPEKVRHSLKYYGFRGSALCLTKSMKDYFSGNSDSETIPETTYPQQMVMFCNTFDGAPPDGEEFSSDILLPDLDSAFAAVEYNTLFVLPAFFQRTVMGYYVTPYVNQDRHNDRLCTFSTTLNRCLETMRMHEHLSALNRRLSFLFTHDQLTGIYNRYGFYNKFSGFINAVGSGKDIFIVSADLNEMKEINDKFGHSAGDDALVLTATALTEAAGDDSEIICSRFGGDEFVVAKVCGGDADAQGERYRSRFVSALAALNASSGYPFEVRVSFGIYHSMLDGVSSIDSLLELADELMYTDKARYKRRPRNLPRLGKR